MKKELWLINIFLCFKVFLHNGDLDIGWKMSKKIENFPTLLITSLQENYYSENQKEK